MSVRVLSVLLFLAAAPAFAQAPSASPRPRVDAVPLIQEWDAVPLEEADRLPPWRDDGSPRAPVPAQPEARRPPAPPPPPPRPDFRGMSEELVGQLKPGDRDALVIALRARGAPRIEAMSAVIERINGRPKELLLQILEIKGPLDAPVARRSMAMPPPELFLVMTRAEREEITRSNSLGSPASRTR